MSLSLLAYMLLIYQWLQQLALKRVLLLGQQNLLRGLNLDFKLVVLNRVYARLIHFPRPVQQERRRGCLGDYTCIYRTFGYIGGLFPSGSSFFPASRVILHDGRSGRSRSRFISFHAQSSQVEQGVLRTFDPIHKPYMHWLISLASLIAIAQLLSPHLCDPIHLALGGIGAKRPCRIESHSQEFQVKTQKEP